MIRKKLNIGKVEILQFSKKLCALYASSVHKGKFNIQIPIDIQELQ